MFTKIILTAAVVFALAVGTALAAPTQEGVKADGLRWQAIARFYAKPAATSSSNDFNWGDAGIGLAGGIGVAALGGAAFAFARRSRRACIDAN